MSENSSYDPATNICCLITSDGLSALRLEFRKMWLKILYISILGICHVSIRAFP
jgi:hypothetical protein